MCCSAWQWPFTPHAPSTRFSICCVAVYGSVLQRVAVYRSEPLLHVSCAPDCLSVPCIRHFTYEWVMSYIWMSHVTHMNQLIHEWVIWISQFIRVNETFHIYEWVTSHIWMGHIYTTHTESQRERGTERQRDREKKRQRKKRQKDTQTGKHAHNTRWIVCLYLDESCNKYERVMSHIWMSHVIHMN